MKKALYFQSGCKPLELDVIHTHEDGTMDLGRDGVVLISNCPMGEPGTDGCCTLETPVVEEGKKKAK
jgi:hypothetical protein